jgi:HlyD family secretion protein
MLKDTAATGLRSLGRRSDSNLIPPQPYPWKTRIALPTGIVLAVLAAAGWSARDALLPATDVRVVPAVLRPQASNGSAEPAPGEARSAGGVIAQAAGWIEPDPYAVAVSALTDGIVRDVLVLEGQRVDVGDIVARLVDDDARLSVQRATADLAARRADLGAAQRHWDNPIERRRAVAATRAALAESHAELAKLDDDVAAEQARVGELSELTSRTEKMVASRSASEQELIILRFRLQAQKAVLQATQSRRPILEARVDQSAAEAKAAEESASLRIEETLALDSAKAAVLQAEAVLAEAQLRLSRTEVRSPAAGVVMNRLVEPGGKLVLGLESPQSAYVARLFDPSKVQVRVDVPLADASKVDVGTKGEITVEALPGKTLQGEVTRVVNEADVTKNTLQFKVRVINPPAGLKPEMLARVKFVAAQKSTAASNAAPNAVQNAVSNVARPGGGSHLPFVPESLVRRDGSIASVIVADRSAGVARSRAVTLGQDSQDGWIVVTSGLAAGDNVIAEPANVPDGARIRVVGEASTTNGKIGG